MAEKKKARQVSPKAARVAQDPLALLSGEPLMPGYMPHHLSRLMNLLNMQLLEYLRPFDVTTQQFRVMQVTNARRVTNVGQIARDAVIEQSLVSRLVDQLEERKLAKRNRSARNARIVEVTLTPRGREVYAAITPYREAIVAEANSVLSEAEKTVLQDLIRRMFRHLSQPRAARAPVARKR